MIEYTLTFNSEQAVMILKAVELLMRIKINQPHEISRAVLDGMSKKLGINEYLTRMRDSNNYLEKAFKEIFPTWQEVEKDREWHVLYDILQSVRYARHNAEFPESTGVDSYPPLPTGVGKIPKCTWIKTEEETK